MLSTSTNQFIHLLGGGVRSSKEGGTSSGRHAQTYDTRVQSKIHSLANLDLPARGGGGHFQRRSTGERAAADGPVSVRAAAAGTG